ncbi:MAG: hypothetical protein WA771_05590, partial [Chthoniobacterales bacterium]
MQFAIAAILGLALLACQVAHGGLLIPFLSMPGYSMLIVAGLLAVFVAVARRGISLSLTLSAAASIFYIGWRCLNAPDAELGRFDLGLLLACGLTWFVVAVALDNRQGRLWMVGIIIALGLVESGFALYQSTQRGASPIQFWFSGDLERLYFGRFGNRARGLFMNPNQLAWTMNATI